VESNTLESDCEIPLQKKRPGNQCLAYSIWFLRCFAEPVRKFAYKKINFLLGSAPGIPVPLFEKHNQMISLLDAVEFIGCEMRPLIVEFSSKLLPSGPQNIVKHGIYLSLIFFLGTIRSNAVTNGSGAVS